MSRFDVLEQRIRFCAGATGRRIAYATVGDGTPLVCAPWWVSHLEHDWSNPRFRDFLEELAQHHTVVRYDRAGVGLSDRTRTAFGPASELADFEAVVDHLGYGRFAIFTQSAGGPVALSFAARCPGRVTRLALYDTFVRGQTLASPGMASALPALVRASWGLGSKVLADLFAPGCSPDEAEALAAFQRVACTGDMAARLMALMYEVDAADDARRVRAPTLVLHRRGDRAIRFEAGREVAALVPTAELVVLEGEIHIPWLGDSRSVTRHVLRFLGDPAPAAAERRAAGPGLSPGTGISPGTGTFLRRGDVWEVEFGGERVHLKHAKGLADLARLLGHAGEEVDATDLACADTPPAPRQAEDLMLDAQALTSYRRRLSALGAEIDDAEARNDLGARDRLTAERESLLEELRRVTRPGGRSRAFAGDRERARKAVSARIRQSLATLRAVHPALADHLDRSIVTGVRCSYAPYPPVTWRT